MKKSNRRQFIKGVVGGLGGMIIGHTAKFFPETQAVWADKGSLSPSTIPLAQVEVGELYEGFLLLPENAPLPNWVQLPLLGAPVVCGGEDAHMDAVTTTQNSVQGLASASGIAMYELVEIPYLRSIGGEIVRYSGGEVFSVSLSYESFNAIHNIWHTTLIIWAMPYYPYPYPIRLINSPEVDTFSPLIEKTNFLEI